MSFQSEAEATVIFEATGAGKIEELELPIEHYWVHPSSEP
jgi:hypothetical protein